MMAERMLGEYAVRQLLGRGGMGEVWEGYDPDLDRRVAIKVILPHLSNDPTFSERLRREAKLVAALRQPNIVQLYDFDIVDGQAIMVMEYLAGGSLRDRLARLHNVGQLMGLATADLLEAVAAGLDYAHERGAVHRDLKPGNILFSEEGQPVIGDFGVAKVVNASSHLMTPTLAEPGSILGTPAYMSPEQASGGEIDYRSDLYSLGVVLYEMVTGRLPFTGESPREILIQHLQHAPPAPRAFNPNLSEGIEEVLLRALAKEPAARYTCAAEMVEALRSAGHLERFVAAPSSSTMKMENEGNAAGLADPVTVSVLPSAAKPAPAQDPPTVVRQPEPPASLAPPKDQSSEVGAASLGDPS
jgi:serine/threonine-protein kinase